MIVHCGRFLALHNQNPSHETALPCFRKKTFQTTFYIKEECASPLRKQSTHWLCFSNLRWFQQKNALVRDALPRGCHSYPLHQTKCLEIESNIPVLLRFHSVHAEFTSKLQANRQNHARMTFPAVAAIIHNLMDKCLLETMKNTSLRT